MKAKYKGKEIEVIRHRLGFYLDDRYTIYKPSEIELL